MRHPCHVPWLRVPPISPWSCSVTLTRAPSARDCATPCSNVLADQAAVVDAALATAKRIASLSPIAVMGTKDNLNFARDHSTASSLNYMVSCSRRGVRCCTLGLVLRMQPDPAA